MVAKKADGANSNVAQHERKLLRSLVREQTLCAPRRMLDTPTKDALDVVPGFCGIKDARSVYVYGNCAYRRLIGLGTHQIEGLTDHDLPCEVAEYADIFQNQDRLAVNEQKELRIIDVHRYPDIGWRTLLLVKRPFPLTPDGEVGTIFHATDITALASGMLNDVLSTHGLAAGQAELANGWQVNTGSQEINLSRRESEVLYYLLRAGTAKSIAANLSLSPRTVEQYIESLKVKFGVPGKVALIQRAMAMGYFFSIRLQGFEQHLSLIVN